MPLPTAAPELHGIRSADLLRLLDRLESNGLDPHAISVIRDGHVLFRGAWLPWSSAQQSQVYSVSKTFTALAIGFLEAEGLVDLSAPVDRYLDAPNPHGITVRNLLAMNSGHSREQTLELPFDVATLLNTPPAAAPGTSFSYNSPASFALSAIVTAVTGQPLTAFLADRLLTPLGIASRWWARVGGLEQGFSGLHLNIDDLSRIGIALAADGHFDGRQVIPTSYIAEATRAWSDTTSEGGGDWALGYGYQLWRSTHGFRLDGAYGQFVLVIPERAMVIAYQGATTDTAAVLQAMWSLVDATEDAEIPLDETARDALLARAETLDSWDARAALSVSDPLADAAGWDLVDDGADGWNAITPQGAIAVPAGRWERTILGEGDELIAVSARGERRADGSVLAHLIVPTSPHRLILTRDADGTGVGWHTTPLWRPTLDALTVPAQVARTA